MNQAGPGMSVTWKNPYDRRRYACFIEHVNDDGSVDLQFADRSRRGSVPIDQLSDDEPADQMAPPSTTVIQPEGIESNEGMGKL